jgi:hypothetical protein
LVGKTVPHAQVIIVIFPAYAARKVIIGQGTKGAKRTKRARGSDTVFWGNNYRLPRVAYRPLYRYVSDGMGMIQGRTTVVTWGKRITS